MRLHHERSIPGAKLLAMLAGLAYSAVLVGSLGKHGRAFAQSGPAQTPASRCDLRGQVVLQAGTPISDSQGGIIARFSGAPSPLAASIFPRDTPGKVRVETGFGAGAFRIAGFVEPSQLPFFTVADVGIAQGHVWIGANHSVTLLGVGSRGLRIEKRLSPPWQQTVTAAASCGAFALEPGTPSGARPADGAHGYELEHDALELYADPSADSPIFTLHRAPNAGPVLLFGAERRSGFVHLDYRGEIVVDAWAKESALSPLPPGEIVDQLAASTRNRSTPQLALQGQPRLVRPSRGVPLRQRASESAKSIGVIEPGTETYVLDQVAGWASVLPKSMNVLPDTDAHFWAKSSDLGL